MDGLNRDICIQAASVTVKTPIICYLVQTLYCWYDDLPSRADWASKRAVIQLLVFGDQLKTVLPPYKA